MTLHPMNKTRSSAQALKWLAGLSIAVVCSAVFAKLAGDIALRETISWDVPLILTIHQFSRPWLDAVMWAITQLGNPGALGTTVMVSVWLWKHRRRLDALTLSASLVGAEALNSLVKIALARPRPLVFHPSVIEHSYSFPSGHTITAVAVYGLLAIWLWQGQRRSWSVVCAALPFLVAVSRI